MMMSMAALVVAIARSGGQESPAIPVGLEGRLKKLEVAMAEQTQRLDETQAQLSVVRQVRDPFQARSTAWPVVARKLSAELRLSPSQMDVLDGALEHCEKAMKNAESLEDPIRRLELSHIARIIAHRKVVEVLDSKQRTRFEAMTKDPRRTDLAAWFLPSSSCCPKKKKKKK